MRVALAVACVATVLFTTTAFAEPPSDSTASPGESGAATVEEQPQSSNPAPATDSIVLANGKIRIGAVFFADFAAYTQTGFGPQFLTQTNFPGPGNNDFTSFDVSRAYINFFYNV